MKRISLKLSNITFQALSTEKGDLLILKNYMPYFINKNIGLSGKKSRELKDFSG